MADRIDTHVSRDFRDSGNAGSAPRQIVIFTSDCFVGHRHLQDILPFLAEHNIRPVIFLTPDCKSPRANIPSLQTFTFYEEGIFNEVIYPAVESRRDEKGQRLSLTFNELARAYGFKTVKVDTLRDSAIEDALASPGTIGALSIYQDAIFKADLIDKVKQKGFFWNLHPAVLPEQKGMYIAFWSLMNGTEKHGYSLHEIDEGVDTGKLISVHAGSLDHSKSVAENYFNFTGGGSALILAALQEYLEKGEVSYINPQAEHSSYYTFPTEGDISAARKNAVRLWPTADEMTRIAAQHFGRDRKLEQAIRKAIRNFHGGYPPAVPAPGSASMAVYPLAAAPA